MEHLSKHVGQREQITSKNLIFMSQTPGSSLVTVIHSWSLALVSGLDSDLTTDATVFSDAIAEVSGSRCGVSVASHTCILYFHPKPAYQSCIPSLQTLLLHWYQSSSVFLEDCLLSTPILLRFVFPSLFYLGLEIL